MAKKIKVYLSTRSIDDAVRELKSYDNHLADKTYLFVKRLAEVGFSVVRTNLDTENNTYIKLSSFENVTKGTLIVEGAEVLFFEFGAGITYNGAAGTSPHPKGEELGYTIGYYGKGKGAQKTWAYYADTGELVITSGTPAQMPVYKASLAMRDQIRVVAREVFGGS